MSCKSHYGRLKTKNVIKATDYIIIEYYHETRFALDRYNHNTITFCLVFTVSNYYIMIMSVRVNGTYFRGHIMTSKNFLFHTGFMPRFCLRLHI